MIDPLVEALAVAAARVIEMLEIPDDEWEEFDRLALTGRVRLLKDALRAVEEPPRA